MNILRRLFSKPLPALDPTATADELDCAFDLHASLCHRCREANYCSIGEHFTLAAKAVRGRAA